MGSPQGAASRGSDLVVVITSRIDKQRCAVVMGYPQTQVANGVLVIAAFVQKMPTEKSCAAPIEMEWLAW